MKDTCSPLQEPDTERGRVPPSFPASLNSNCKGMFHSEGCNHSHCCGWSHSTCLLPSLWEQFIIRWWTLTNFQFFCRVNKGELNIVWFLLIRTEGWVGQIAYCLLDHLLKLSVFFRWEPKILVTLRVILIIIKQPSLSTFLLWSLYKLG